MEKLIAANWKMYKTAEEAASTLGNVARRLGGRLPEGRSLLVFAPFTALAATVDALRALPGSAAGAQNMYPADEGAFTGEISPQMIQASGASWALAGHSERRSILGESDVFVGQKTAFALSRGLRVVLCVGESLAERESGALGDVLARQLRFGLAGLRETLDPSMLAVAYEPVWAIGTGKTASLADIVDAHALARELVKENLGPTGLNVRLLYGGSVKPDNAAAILALDNVDGVLVGGASLEADALVRIVTA